MIRGSAQGKEGREKGGWSGGWTAPPSTFVRATAEMKGGARGQTLERRRRLR